MSDTTNKSTRRDFLKTMGGALGGISLLGHGAGRGRALGSIPNSYTFYRILTANTPLASPMGDITGSVMLASPLSKGGIGYVYVHGVENQQSGSRPGVFEVAINFSQVPPVVHRVLRIAIEGNILNADGRNIEVGHVGTGACNALGEYVTTIDPADGSGTIDVANSPGVYLYRPSGTGNGSWSRIIGFGDPVPGDNSFYGGDFGDVALDDNENLLLAAATTQTPGANVSGFAGSQALIATSLGATSTGRVVLQTGDMLPFGSAAIQSVGLVDLAANRAFAAQVTAKLLDPAVTRPGTALIAGNTRAALAQQGIVAASPELMSSELAAQRNIFSGQTFFGPRVDPRLDVAFVTHDSTFVPSTGSNAVETLGYYSRGSASQLQQTQAIGSASDDQVIAFGAPCIDSSGLMYGTEMLGDGSTRLFISDGVNSQVVLRSRDLVNGIAPSGPLTISEILFGQHSTQVDAFGRLVFAAEFSLNPNGPQNSTDVITALVIGIPR